MDTCWNYCNNFYYFNVLLKLVIQTNVDMILILEIRFREIEKALRITVFLILVLFVSSCATIPFDAVRSNNVVAVREAISSGANVNAKDKNGWTALMQAAYNNSLEVAKLLIKKGADVNARDIQGNTILIVALENNSLEIAKLLIEKGTDINAKNNGGESALTLTTENLVKIGKPVVKSVIKALKDSDWHVRINAALILDKIRVSTKKAIIEPMIPSHYITYTDKSNFFSISYPPSWKVVPPLKMKTTQEDADELLARISSNFNLEIEKGGIIFCAGLPTGIWYAPNIAISIDSLPKGIETHEEYVEATIQGTKRLIENYQEFSRFNTIVDRRKVTILEWEGIVPQLGKQRNLVMIILIGKTVWRVGSSLPPREFIKWKDDLYAIVRSFRILK